MPGSQLPPLNNSTSPPAIFAAIATDDIWVVRPRGIADAVAHWNGGCWQRVILGSDNLNRRIVAIGGSSKRIHAASPFQTFVLNR